MTVSPSLATSLSPSEKSGSRISYLDSVRGLAALSVVANHYVLAYGLPRGRWLFGSTPLSIWWDGPAAVSLFFVLSGLVLSLKHFRTSKKPDLSNYSISGYCIARVFRIWLPYFVVFALSVVAFRWVTARPETVPALSAWGLKYWSQPVSGLGFANSATLVGPRYAVQDNLMPQAWTLRVELIISLLIPLGVAVAGRGLPWLFALVLFGSQFLGAPPYLFHFALGIAIAKYQLELRGWLEARLWARIGIALVGVLLYTSRNTLFHRDRTMIWYFTGVGAAMILLFVISTPWARKVLSIPVLHYLGRISYSVYLVHFAILMALTPLFLSAMNSHALTHVWAAGLAFTVLFTFILAEIIYRIAELPSISMGKKAMSVCS